MKVLGKNSLSSKLFIGVKIVSVITICIMCLIATITIKDWRDLLNNQTEKLAETILITGVFIAGFLFIAMLTNLAKFFKNLKEQIYFDNANIMILNRVSNLILGGATIYGIMAILHIVFANNYLDIVTYNIFLWILTIIMFCLSFGMKIFIEIYKKAIEYKEENDFTI